MFKIPRKYIPKSLRTRDLQKQTRNIQQTRKLYKKKKYLDRPKLESFQSKPSPHVVNAKKMYNVSRVVPSKELSKATKCSMRGLRQITKKGRGAYYSSGSRPNQTAQSWARARLGSALTGANASVVDYHILEKECQPGSKALILAKRAIKNKTRKNRN